jgi:Malectin domain/IPT/TIG domain
MATTVNTIVSVPSSNRFIRISFTNVVQYAKVNAIEIKPYDRSITEAPTLAPLQEPTVAPTKAVFRGYLINCGYNLPYVDSLARTWLPDQFFQGGTTTSNTFPIANTVDDKLYNEERVGDEIMYNFSVPIGTFQVNLFFAETVFSEQDQRLFDIIIEEALVETSVDLIKFAGGPKTAVRLQFFQLVEDGFLEIRLVKSPSCLDASVPTISAIEIVFDKEHVAHAVAYGPYVGTVTDSIRNTALVELVGQTSHTHGEGLELTQTTWKEGNTTLGTALNINYDFAVGVHTIALTVKDSGDYTDTEVATVTIKPFGFPAVTELNPNNGSLVGDYFIVVRGSGFNYTSDRISVLFGRKSVTGSNITVVDSTTLRVRVPSSVVARSLNVVVQTPLGRSDSNTLASEFTYINTVPIQWTNGSLFSFRNPSVGRFGPDQRLYIGTRHGYLIRLTLNADFTRTIASLISWVNPRNETMYVGPVSKTLNSR